jgi:hypothetical protein
MYSLSSEEYFTKSITENTSPPYTLPLNDFGESNDQLADQITTLSGQINAATYHFLKLIAEFDRRQAWAGAGIRSCAHWLNWKCGIAMNAAREKIRTARALEGLPGINEASLKLSAFKLSALKLSTLKASEPCQLIMHIRAGDNHPASTPSNINLCNPPCGTTLGDSRWR